MSLYLHASDKPVSSLIDLSTLVDGETVDDTIIYIKTETSKKVRAKVRAKIKVLKKGNIPILIPNLKTINLTFGGLSPILYVKEDLNFGRFFRFYFVMELNKIILLPIPTGWGDSNRHHG